MKIALRVSANRLLTHLNETEENVIYRSLLDVNIPKIHPNDIPLFKSIINDLFPNAISEEKMIGYDWLRETFERRCNEKKYQTVESLYRKLVETYEMSSYRQGVMLIGNPYTGKSFVLQTLIEAMKSKEQLESNEMDLGILEKVVEHSILFFCVSHRFLWKQFLDLKSETQYSLNEMFIE